MAFPAWDTTNYNNNALRDSYHEKPERWNVDSFEPDNGPPLEGLNAATSTDQISFELKLTATEWANLRTFWRTTLSSGIAYFTMTNPLTGTAGENYKFVSEPELRSVFQLKYRVTVSLRRFNNG
jgi:hypothetical protein